MRAAAHDFNNSLITILGYSELLLAHPEHLRNEEKALRFLRSIHDAAVEAGKVVTRLSALARARRARGID